MPSMYWSRWNLRGRARRSASARGLDRLASGSGRAPGRRARLRSGALQVQEDENGAGAGSWQRFAHVAAQPGPRREERIFSCVWPAFASSHALILTRSWELFSTEFLMPSSSTSARNAGTSSRPWFLARKRPSVRSARARNWSSSSPCSPCRRTAERARGQRCRLDPAGRAATLAAGSLLDEGLQLGSSCRWSLSLVVGRCR